MRKWNKFILVGFTSRNHFLMALRQTFVIRKCGKMKDHMTWPVQNLGNCILLYKPYMAMHITVTDKTHLPYSMSQFTSNDVWEY